VGLRVCRSVSPGACALPFGSAGLASCGSDGCARVSRSIRSRRPARSSGLEQDEPFPPCCRSMPCGPVDVDDAEGCFRCARHKPEGQGASDSNRNRSGSDPQVHQPFELADFLTKAMHPRAVCRLHPHGGREVTVPGRPVPVPSLGRGTWEGYPRAAASQAAIISASSSANRARRQATFSASTCRSSGCGKADWAGAGRIEVRGNVDGGGDAAPPAGGRWVMTVSLG
jgi:hypothetical protein